MNYFLYGPDTYRSRKKLHEIADAYRAKWAATADLHWIDARESGIGALEDAGGTASLFSRKKMIVVERAVSSGVSPERLIVFLKKYKTSHDVIVIVWEETTGEAQKKVCADVKACADKTQEFTPLAGIRLTRWIREEARRRSVRLSAADMAHLAACGPDLWTIANEMEKIAVGGGAVRAADEARLPVRLHSRVQTQAGRVSSAFDLSDAFFSSRRDALRHLLSLADQGEDPLPLFSYLANHTRTALVLKICAERNMSVPPALAIHPYVIKKTTRLIDGLNRDALIKTIRRFFEEDAAIKTGDARPYESLLRMLL